MHVVITHPDFGDPGGIAAYFGKLKNKFALKVTHFPAGRRPGESGTWARLVRFVRDNAALSRLLRAGHVDLVHLNASLSWLGLTREAVFLWIARRKGVPALVFFHGWLPKRERFIERYCLWLFKLPFRHAAAFVVLSDRSRDTLRRWGFAQEIHKEVTVIDDEEMEGIDFERLSAERAQADRWRILFLSRVLRNKGIYEALDTAGILAKAHPDVELVVAGDGAELAAAREYARKSGLSNVRFLGYVLGDEKKRALETAHLFFLPSYSEGYPNALVEAMTYGLPVVTRAVGGIPDYFVDGEHGFMTDSLNAEVFAELVGRLYCSEELYANAARNVHAFALGHFGATAAAKRLEKIYLSIGERPGKENG